MGMDAGATLAVAALVAALGVSVYLVVGARGRRGIATDSQRATYEVLHRAGLAAEPLRVGLDQASATKAVQHLRALVDGVALGIADRKRLLALEGPSGHHSEQLAAFARRTAASGRTAIMRARDLPCDEVDCPVRGAVVAPLKGADPDGTAIGALVAAADGPPPPGLAEATVGTAPIRPTPPAPARLDP